MQPASRKRGMMERDMMTRDMMERDMIRRRSGKKQRPITSRSIMPRRTTSRGSGMPLLECGMPSFPRPLASKLPNVGTTIFTVMSRLAQEHGAINLSQGFPDFDCAQALRDLATRYLNAG